MIGTHADAVVADAFRKGMRNYDVEKAYTALRKDGVEKGTGIFRARVGIEDYLRLGYVPADKYGESAARTLEFALDDFCLSQLAPGLGKEGTPKCSWITRRTIAISSIRRRDS